MNFKERSPDRVFVLEQREGEKPSSSSGLVDPRLFKGGNRLHAIQDPETCHWYMKYEMGGLPEPLKGKYTSFPRMVEAARTYFNTRAIDVKEVIDEPKHSYVIEPRNSEAPRNQLQSNNPPAVPGGSPEIRPFGKRLPDSAE